MRLTDAQSQTLLDINYGERPRIKSAYDSRTIDALKDRGLVTVRDNDGELRITSSGEGYLAVNHPPKKRRTEL